MEADVQILDYILTILNVVLAVAAIAGMLFSIFKYVIPAWIRIGNSLKKIDTIDAELRPNGGSSLRDRVDGLVIKVSEVADGLELADARAWAIVSTAKNPTWESNDIGECVRANSAYLELVGRSRDDIAINGWENIIHKDDQMRVWREWNDAVKQRRTFESSYRIINHVSNAVFTVDGKGTPIINRSGKVCGWIGTYNNVVKTDEIVDRKSPRSPRRRRAAK